MPFQIEKRLIHELLEYLIIIIAIVLTPTNIYLYNSVLEFLKNWLAMCH